MEVAYMNREDQLENRIARLEGLLKKESLEQRVSKLEKMFLEEDDSAQPESPEDYLMILLNMLFKSRKVNPEGNSIEGNYEFYKAGQYTGVNVLNRAIGDWEVDRVVDRDINIVDADTDPNDMKYNDVIPVDGKPGEYYHPRSPGQSAYTAIDEYKLTNEAEIKKIIGAFCKINKCLVDYNLYSLGNNTKIQLTLKKSPSFQPVNRRRQWGDSDSDWETLDDQERRHNSLRGIRRF
jgi:hypothetical protein